MTATAEEELHQFVERDQATEHLPVIVRQCAAYEAYRATGRYQAAHGLFPAVLWVVPTAARATALRAAIAAAAARPGRARLTEELFSVCTTAEYPGRIGGGQANQQPRGQKGGTT